MGAGAGALKNVGSDVGNFVDRMRGSLNRGSAGGVGSMGGDLDADELDDNDIVKLRKSYRATQQKLRTANDQLAQKDERVKELSHKLQEMLAALKLMKTENKTLASHLEQAESHLAQMENPEREASMHKYALEKLKEDYERYKLETADKETKLNQELRRLQENLANRSAADEAAKAALRAEIRELRSERGLIAGGFADAQHAPANGAPAPAAPSPAPAQRYDATAAGKSVGAGGKKEPEVAAFHPSSNLKPKTVEAEQASKVVVDKAEVMLATEDEAKMKRREAAARSGIGYLKEKGVLPYEPGELSFEDDQEEKAPVWRIVDFVADPEMVETMYGDAAYQEEKRRRRRGHEDEEDEEELSGARALEVIWRDVELHRDHVESFGTQRPDAYGTEPYLIRGEGLDLLMEYVTTTPGSGMGKSHLLAAMVCQLQIECLGDIVVPLFVGSSAPSRDTRLILRSLAVAIANALPPLPPTGPLQRPQERYIPHELEELKRGLTALLEEASGLRKRCVIVVDGLVELHDLYMPQCLEWLPALLAPAMLILSLDDREQLHLVSNHVQVDALLELSLLDEQQKVGFLRYLVTKHNTAVETELAKQKEEMRAKAMAELRRLQEERMQRRLQRERLRGPSKRKGKKKHKDKPDASGGKDGGRTAEPGGAEGEEELDENPPDEDKGDEGLLGEYEMQVMVEKEDSGLAVYLVMAVEFLLSLERTMPALEEATALPGTIDGLVDHILDLLESKHGKELVRNSLMLLASVRYGMSQAELLQHLLSTPEHHPAIDDEIDTDQELMLAVPDRLRWTRFVRDLTPLLRPRGTSDPRAQDLRVRHSVVRDQVLRRYCTHRCFWHRASSMLEVHHQIANFYLKVLEQDMPPIDVAKEAPAMEVWVASELLWQYTHAAQDLVFHLIAGGNWKGTEEALTSLRYIENKCRAADPYQLLTDFSAALDAVLFHPLLSDDDEGANSLSYVQRIRVTDFHNFVKTFAPVFQSHPELVVQQAANMPDDSPVAREALRIVGDVEVDTAWFKYINKSQLADPCIMSLKCNGPIDVVCYSPDGRRIASGSGDGFGGKLTLWDARSGQETKGYAMPGAIKSACFSGDGKLLLGISNEGTALLLDMLSLKERCRQVVSDTHVSAGAITIDGKKMILVSLDGIINVWDVAQETSGGGTVSNRFVKMFEIQDEDDEGRPSPMTCVAVSPNVKRVFTGMSGGLMKIFELSPTEGLTVLHVLTGHNSVIPVCSFSADGQRVCTASLDHTLKIWDVQRGGKPITSFTDKSEIRGCHFSPDGTFVAAALDDGTIELLDMSTGQSVMTFGSHSGRVNTVQFAPNGKSLVSGSMDGLAKVWAIQEGNEADTFQGHPNTAVTACAYSADGTELATAGGDGSLKLWGGKRGKELMQFPGHDDGVSACAFSPVVGDRKGGILTASLLDGTYRLWNSLTGQEEADFRHTSTSVTCAAFSVDGHRVLSGSYDGSALIWEIDTQKLIIKLGVEVEGQGGWRIERIRDRHEDAVMSCCWSPVPDSDRAVTTSADSTVKVWNTQWGNCVGTLKGHTAAVEGCCYTKDGKSLITCSADRTIREWQSGPPFKCLAVIVGHTAPVHQVSFATSGAHLFSSCEDRTLRAWLRVPLEEEPPSNVPAPRVGSKPFSTSTRSTGDGNLDWFQWRQVALFASGHPLRCLAGSQAEEEEEVACGGADGSVYLLRLMLPGDY